MKPNNFTTTYFAAAACLLLTATVLVVGETLTRPTIDFGDCYLRAEVVRTAQEQAKGLSGRSSIPADYAMVFPFPKSQPSFWMKGMLTPIDIIWVDENRKVVQIDPTVPVDDGAQQYTPPTPISWVVEVAPGRTAACNVSVGTEIKGLKY